MNIANFFTATRMVAAPLFICIYYLPRYVGISEQTVMLILIPLFGKLFDPFADVFANLTVLLAFMLSGYVPLPVFIIILYRELNILFLRMLARGNGITIGAKKGGKTKTVCYILAEGFTLLIELLIVFSLAEKSVTDTMIIINKSIYWVAALLSVCSFIDYLVSYRKSIRGKSKN